MARNSRKTAHVLASSVQPATAECGPDLHSRSHTSCLRGQDMGISSRAGRLIPLSQSRAVCRGTLSTGTSTEAISAGPGNLPTAGILLSIQETLNLHSLEFLMCVPVHSVF